MVPAASGSHRRNWGSNTRLLDASDSLSDKSASMRPVRAPTLLLLPLLLLFVLVLAPKPSLAQAASADDSFIDRPIYSEPTTGLQMPPTCVIEPSWRARSGSDFELWIVVCGETPHAWLVRRQVVEMLGAGLARLRYQVIDERVYPGESAGESVSVQCTGRGKDQDGYLVVGAKWRADGKELRLSSALTVMHADPVKGQLINVDASSVDCVRFPQREATMRQLQQAPR
jgi:hypothetical protein